MLSHAHISRPPDFSILFCSSKLGLYASIYGKYTDFNHWSVNKLKLYLQQRGISCSDLWKFCSFELFKKSQEIGLEIVKTPHDYNSSVGKRQTAVADGNTTQLPNAEKLESSKWSCQKGVRYTLSNIRLFNNLLSGWMYYLHGAHVPLLCNLYLFA